MLAACLSILFISILSLSGIDTGTCYSILRIFSLVYAYHLTTVTQYKLVFIFKDFISLFGPHVILGAHILLAVFCYDPKSFA